MSNTNIKFLFLIFVNVVVLALVFIYVQSDHFNKSEISKESLVDLIASEKRLNAKVETLELELELASKKISEAELAVEHQKLISDDQNVTTLSCDRQKETLTNQCEVAQRDTQQQYAEQIASLQSSLATAQARIASLQTSDTSSSAPATTPSYQQENGQSAKIASLEQQVNGLRDETAELQAKLDNSQQTLANKDDIIKQLQIKKSNEVEALVSKVNLLKETLGKPVAIDNHYLSARFCDKPKFDSLMCVQEFLVRPSFTKLPVTRIGITVLDSDGQVAAEGEFDSSVSQLYRLTMGRGKEFKAGQYSVRYEVDNLVLTSEQHSLSQ